jgi:hypothetical protein
MTSAAAVSADTQLDEIKFVPTFDDPMYLPLRSLGNEHLLPAVEKNPQNTVGILKTNRRFLESYIVGLNHEFAAELLWRDYPTDQKGTYFAHFWDKLNGGPDVKDLDQWKAFLGGNAPPENETLVLVIRGELLLRYPNALVYAVYQKVINGKTMPNLEEFDPSIVNATRYFPLFSGVLPPDLTFLGFFPEMLANNNIVTDSTTNPTKKLTQSDWRDAAKRAAYTFQSPCRIIIPARRLIPEEK